MIAAIVAATMAFSPRTDTTLTLTPTETRLVVENYAGDVSVTTWNKKTDHYWPFCHPPSQVLCTPKNHQMAPAEEIKGGRHLLVTTSPKLYLSVPIAVLSTTSDE